VLDGDHAFGEAGFVAGLRGASLEALHEGPNGIIMVGRMPDLRVEQECRGA
jgi:hypothetical protein